MKYAEKIFLIVDDDGLVRDILVQYLKSFGFHNILEAKNGKAALKLIRATPNINFIISDWEMPHIDGLTLLKAVRKETGLSHVLFLMVTSQGSRERMKITKAAKAHVDAYIVKPFRSEILKEKVMNLLNGKGDPSADFFEESLADEFGNVDVAERAAGELGDVYESGEFDPENPPEEIDVTRLNIILILKLVNSYKKIKWFEKAVKLCQDADDHFPDNADVLYNLGHCHYLLGEMTQAEEFLRKAVKVNKYHVESFDLLSKIPKAA